MTCSHCGKTAEQNNNWVLCPYYKYAPVCMTHCYSDCKRFDMAVGKCIYTLRKAERNGKKSNAGNKNALEIAYEPELSRSVLASERSGHSSHN